jgi:hypothetical protein
MDNMNEKVIDLIVALGEEAGEFVDGMDRVEFAEAVISNSNIEGYEHDALEAFQAAADGDTKALIAIRTAWGLRPIV